MCGIFGYVNYTKPRTRREILNVLIEGLQRVEYRGYDSAGLCVDSQDASRTPLLIRSVGNISQLRECVFSGDSASDAGLDVSFDVHVGVGHTRWATHGVPCVSNCHPQASNGNEFFVVHNGIVTNFMPIKQMLLAEGYRFDSDTDTEVVAVLAEHFYAAQPTLSFAQLATKLTGMIEGAYALLIKSRFFPGEVIACRRNSPLMIGVQCGASCKDPDGVSASPFTELYFASDLNSFIARTQEIIFLEDGDIAHFHDGALEFYTMATGVETRVTRTSEHVEHAVEGTCKNGYDNFLLKEIYEQPDSLIHAMRGRVNFKTGHVQFDGIDANTAATFRKARRVMLIACGTSYHSCLAVRPIFEELLVATCVVVENAPDFMDRRPHVFSDDLCVFVSQSGETADTLMALQHCKENGAVLVGVTNVPGSSLLRSTNHTIFLNAGTEVSVASTKAYTSQVVVLTLFALFMSQDDGSGAPSGTANGRCTNNISNNCSNVQGCHTDSKQVQKRRAEIFSGIAALPGAVATCLERTRDVVASLAETWRGAGAILVLGRGYDFPTALEAALKIKELSYVFTEGIHSGELKHGPLALVDDSSCVISFCAHDRFFDRSKGAIQQVRARGGRVVAVTTGEDAEVLNATTMCIVVPAVVDCLQGVVNVVPLQLFAYYLALQHGHNVDFPRNLAKSVTVQ